MEGCLRTPWDQDSAWHTGNAQQRRFPPYYVSLPREDVLGGTHLLSGRLVIIGTEGTREAVCVGMRTHVRVQGMCVPVCVSVHAERVQVHVRVCTCLYTQAPTRSWRGLSEGWCKPASHDTLCHRDSQSHHDALDPWWSSHHRVLVPDTEKASVCGVGAVGELLSRREPNLGLRGSL